MAGSSGDAVDGQVIVVVALKLPDGRVEEKVKREKRVGDMHMDSSTSVRCTGSSAMLVTAAGERD